VRWGLDRWTETLPDARILGDLSALEAVETFFIDSRTPPNGGMFVPLKGENTDGHQYLTQALSAVDASFCSAGFFDTQSVVIPSGKVLVVVPDVLEALAAFAAAHLDAFGATLRLGVTGSNGKTTTKELLAAALEVFGPTYATAGNWNSEIGVPLTALGMEKGFSFGVFEMGINHRGEMDLLASVVRPLLSIITNIGTAHIGMIGSQHEIALEKKKIFSRSGSFAIAVLPAADKFLPVLTEGFDGTVKLFGRSQPGFRLIADHGLDGTEFEWKGTAFRLSLPGLHHIDNALAVLAAVEALGLDWRRCAPALASVGAAFGRGQVEHGSIDLLLDCYNANFDSMLGLLELVRTLPKPTSGRMVLVLGSMKELGADSEALHRKLGAAVANLDVDAVFFFGVEAEVAYAACVSGGFASRAEWVSDFDELNQLVRDFVRPGDLVVLKGSRSNRLERLRDLWFAPQEAGHVL
jgi:UDP-N-acetylmuramoyl-tripeptide--D-alanyl-D-alanine ligase